MRASTFIDPNAIYHIHGNVEATATGQMFGENSIIIKSLRFRARTLCENYQFSISASHRSPHIDDCLSVISFTKTVHEGSCAVYNCVVAVVVVVVVVVVKNGHLCSYNRARYRAGDR